MKHRLDDNIHRTRFTLLSTLRPIGILLFIIVTTKLYNITIGKQSKTKIPSKTQDETIAEEGNDCIYTIDPSKKCPLSMGVFATYATTRPRPSDRPNGMPPVSRASCPNVVIAGYSRNSRDSPI